MYGYSKKIRNKKYIQHIIRKYVTVNYQSYKIKTVNVLKK